MAGGSTSTRRQIDIRAPSSTLLVLPARVVDIALGGFGGKLTDCLNVGEEIAEIPSVQIVCNSELDPADFQFTPAEEPDAVTTTASSAETTPTHVQPV